MYYTSIDGQLFDTEEELQAYESAELKRFKLKLNLDNFIGCYVKDELWLNRMCAMELDNGYQTFISSAITLPDWIISFTDHEVKELHVFSLKEMVSYISKHVSKVLNGSIKS